MDRRAFLKLTAGAASLPALSLSARAEAPLGEIRIGYQKNGVLVIARQRRTLEYHFAPRNIAVKWVEFSSGPPMLEAMNAGSVDYGAVGDTPPIFAQAAGSAIVYAAGQQITNGQGILVPKDSPIRSIADLKGKRIGFTKGSSAHNIVLLTLAKAGLSYADITPVYLTPPDAGPAFAQGGIDAWAVFVCLNQQSSAGPSIARSDRFAVNILAADQLEIGERFAGKGGIKGDARFATGAWTVGRSGAPILTGALTAIECALEETLVRHTHVILIGRALYTTTTPHRASLTYRQGGYVALDRDEDLARLAEVSVPTPKHGH